MFSKKTAAKAQTAAAKPATASKQATVAKPATASKHATAGKPTTATKHTAASRPAIASKPATARKHAAKTLTAGQRAYEAKRAAKAGVSLEKWLDTKQREQQAEERARLKAAEAAKPPKKPGFFARLIERAQRPLGSSSATARTPPR